MKSTKLTLEEWDELIGRHLHMIEAGAEICERHTKMLLGLPEWETRAAQDIDKVERLLGQALTRIAKVRQEMRCKPLVS